MCGIGGGLGCSGGSSGWAGAPQEAPAAGPGVEVSACTWQASLAAPYLPGPLQVAGLDAGADAESMLAAAQAFLLEYCSIVVCSRGAKGCVARSRAGASAAAPASNCKVKGRPEWCCRPRQAGAELPKWGHRPGLFELVRHCMTESVLACAGSGHRRCWRPLHRRLPARLAARGLAAGMRRLRLRGRDGGSAGGGCGAGGRGAGSASSTCGRAAGARQGGGRSAAAAGAVAGRVRLRLGRRVLIDSCVLIIMSTFCRLRCALSCLSCRSIHDLPSYPLSFMSRDLVLHCHFILWS